MNFPIVQRLTKKFYNLHPSYKYDDRITNNTNTIMIKYHKHTIDTEMFVKHNNRGMIFSEPITHNQALTFEYLKEVTQILDWHIKHFKIKKPTINISTVGNNLIAFTLLENDDMYITAFTVRKDDTYRITTKNLEKIMDKPVVIE